MIVAGLNCSAELAQRLFGDNPLDKANIAGLFNAVVQAKETGKLYIAVNSPDQRARLWRIDPTLQQEILP